jgi:hypothetical protein
MKLAQYTYYVIDLVSVLGQLSAICAVDLSWNIYGEGEWSGRTRYNIATIYNIWLQCIYPATRYLKVFDSVNVKIGSHGTKNFVYFFNRSWLEQIFMQTALNKFRCAFTEIFMKILDKVVPVKEITIKHKFSQFTYKMSIC